VDVSYLMFLTDREDYYNIGWTSVTRVENKFMKKLRSFVRIPQAKSPLARPNIGGRIILKCVLQKWIADRLTSLRCLKNRA